MDEKREIGEEVVVVEKIADIVEKHQLPKACPKIDWGGDFEDMKSDEKVVFLKKFADSFNHALDLMQKERDEWKARSDSYEAQLLSCRDNLTKQMAMSQQFAQDNNETKRVYHEKIAALENKIRELS